MKTMKVTVLTSLLSGLSLACLAASADTLDTLRAGVGVQIVNESDFTIREIYLSQTHDPVWHGDWLGRHTLQPGYHIRLDAITAGQYDLKIVDEDGDVCDIRDVSISRNHTLTIGTTALLRCEGYL